MTCAQSKQLLLYISVSLPVVRIRMGATHAHNLNSNEEVARELEDGIM